MKLAVISPLGVPYDTEPYVVPPDIRVFGHGAYSLLYPDDPFYYLAPSDTDRFFASHSVDAVLFNPTSDYARLLEMIAVADALLTRPNRPALLCLDCDMASGWLQWYPTITEATVRLFDLCDAVLCRDERQVGFVETFSKRPAFWLPEVSTFASFYPPSRPVHPKVLLLPTTHCGTYNSRRFSMGNYAVAKRLSERCPGYEVRVLSNRGKVSLPELGDITEQALLERLGCANFRLISLNPGARYDIVNEFRQARLLVNLDFEPATGHWQMDAAAMGVPALCSDYTCAGHVICEGLAAHPYDMDRFIRRGVELLTDDDAWASASETVSERVREFTADAIRGRFEEIWASI